MTGMHALHKILIDHAHPRPKSVTTGEFLEIEPDIFAIGLKPNAEGVERLEAALAELGVKELAMKGRIFAYLDKDTPAPSSVIAFGHKRWKDFFQSHGIPVRDGGAGISHLIIPEQGYVTPGSIIGRQDSHTPTMGAVGAFASAYSGGSLPLSILSIGRYWVDVPKISLYRIEGKLRKGVFARDVSLYINGRVGQRGGLGKAIEFGGSYVRDLSMDMRFTLCNMGTEMGATASYIQPDQTTLDWVKGRAKIPIKVCETDADYEYDETQDFDVSMLEPQIAIPNAPDKVKPIGEVEGRHIDQAYLGSCASGRLEDIAAAAAVMKGRKVHPDVRFIVTPGSREVLMAATRLGYIDVLNEANVIVTSASCGACHGSNGGVLAPGEVAISCNTRNFPGRMGRDAEIYLASPAAVAASAVEGRIASPVKYL